LLQGRQDMRHEELKRLFERGLREIFRRPFSVPVHHWHPLRFLEYYNSFDAIARFVANYLPEEQQWTPEPQFQPTAHPAQESHVLRPESATPSFVTAPSPSPSPPSPTTDTAALPPQPAELDELHETVRETRRTSCPPRRTAAHSWRGRAEGVFRSPSRVQKRPQGRRGSSPRHQESPNTRVREQTGTHPQPVPAPAPSPAPSPATAVPTTTATTSGQKKRKRDEQKEEDHNQTRSGIKRRRTDTHRRSPRTSEVSQLPEDKMQSTIPKLRQPA
jgi:hypothetical protein